MKPYIDLLTKKYVLNRITKKIKDPNLLEINRELHWKINKELHKNIDMHFKNVNSLLEGMKQNKQERREVLDLLSKIKLKRNLGKVALNRKLKLPVKPLGSWLLEITEFLYCEKDNERIFTPIISDMREEWFKAYDQKKFMKARWINFRYSCAFIQAMGINVGISLVKKFFDAWHVGE